MGEALGNALVCERELVLVLAELNRVVDVPPIRAEDEGALGDPHDRRLGKLDLRTDRAAGCDEGEAREERASEEPTARAKA
jgi:hypothetical protein